jgi:signal peptidase I
MAKDQGKEAESPKESHAWRENIEAITMAIVMAVMLKYFIVEAYKIPTGSMQPTLMGNTETDILDRILVDKFSYHFREPERFEVTVFKYPLDLSKNFVKRMVGVGPEELKLHNGDLWNRPDATHEWKVLRRPRPVQEETWKELFPGQAGLEGWKAIGGARTWTVDGEDVIARGDGSLRYPGSRAIKDDYRDGYPLSIRGSIRPNGLSNGKSVGDLRVSGEIEALAGCKYVTIELREGNRQYRFILPGPAAGPEQTLRIEAEDTVLRPGTLLVDMLSANSNEGWKLQAGSSIEFGVQNLDDMLSLEIDGEIVLELEVPTANDQASCVFLHSVGEGVDISDLMVYRDIYYLSDINSRETKWSIPADHYVMLGDNTQNSSDSREWQLAVFEYPQGSGNKIRGNFRGGGENPHTVVGGPDGPIQWFRDEFGEMHHWKQGEAGLPTYVPVSLVPRKLVTGRSVVVFWPIKPSYKLWRLAWVH